MSRRFRAAILTVGLLLAGCGGKRQPVERVSGDLDVSGMALREFTGVSDGDRLRARARFAGDNKELSLELKFRVGVPTRLESGTWSGLGEAGVVQERSSTFLGGQSGPPSLGGRFDLVGPGNVVLYRVTIPVRELRFGI